MENENVKVDTYDREAVEKDYRESWMPHIHNIGQSTMLIGYALMFVPGLFMYFVMGWNEIPFSTWVGYVAFILPLTGVSLAIEHSIYYPMCGATTIYMGYLAGNVSGMRVPVAQACATAADDDVMSAKAQVAITIGVAVSVVANVVILILITLFGNVVLGIIPAVVKSALGLVTHAIFGYLLVSNVFGHGKGNMVKGFGESWYWFILGIGLSIIYHNYLPIGKSLYMLWTMLSCLVIAIIMEKLKEKKAETKAEA